MHFIYSYFPLCLNRNCHDSKTDCFKIQDTPSGRSVIYDISAKLEHPFITIKNNDGREVKFLAIDECIINSSIPIKRCDCLVCDDMDLYFIEIKKAGSPNEVRRIEKKIEAIEKLRCTLILFKSKNIKELTNHRKESILCVGFKSQIPKSYSSMKDYRAEFALFYNCELCEGSQIDFG